MITTIALDIDGVLADFNSGYDFSSSTKEEWQWKFPKFVKDGGFATLPVLPDAFDLIRYLQSTNLKVFYLSSAGGIQQDLFIDVAKQKIRWLISNGFPSWIPVIVPKKEVKALYAAHDILLIDDQWKNVDAFITAGGRGITHTSAEQTIDLLSNIKDF